MTDLLTPFVWVALGAAVVPLLGLGMLLGRGGARDDMGRKTFRLRPLRRLVGLLLAAWRAYPCCWRCRWCSSSA